MRLATSLFRSIRFGLQNFFRNFWLSAATVSVLVLALFSVNLLLSLNVLGRSALESVKSKIDVGVHFKPEIEDSRVQTVKVALLSLPEVKDVQYVSPAEALQKFSADFNKDEAVLQSLGEVGSNPFGASLLIKARDLNGYPKIMETLAEPLFASLIEEKDYDDRQGMIARLQSLSSKAEMGGLGVSGLFVFIALLIVFNTIRMSIYTHREEIGIMRLVGASDWFIRTPFYVEAVLWSLIAVGACAGVLLPAAAFAGPYLQSFFGTGSADLFAFFRGYVIQIFGLEFLIVALLAIMTTKAAATRYLKV